ncbi:MAG TPA: GNAT family N-acetyltransferase [Asticcacaulis sp.]|nr:GNAT family N-acetyltransferase [Asticcacaulis sp.]
MDNGLHFRPATAQDFAAVLDLATQLARHIEAAPPPLTFGQFEARYLGTDPRMHLLLAVKDGHVAGLVSWILTHELYSGEARVYISDLAVDGAARGQGIGTALLAEVKAWARRHGAAKLGWEVWRRNASAKAFYAGQGAEADNEAIPYVLTLNETQS